LVEPTNTQELVASLLAVGLGAAGIAVAWAIYSAAILEVPRLALVQRTLEHKFWFDELYDAVFYRPADALARGLGRVVEAPLIAGSLDALGFGAREAWSGTSRVQTGLVRSYVLALAGAMAVLVVVFLSVR
ncbi:MAG TPA: hypothetical protein VLN26_03605, partial [Gaiellaceae bacterium]|nr:hypothetical protein [Gaiellaceae bacterium]